MNKTLKTTRFIRRRIEEISLGEPFTPTIFLVYGTRASVDQALSRSVKAMRIEHVTCSAYVRAEVSRFIGKVMPEPMKVAQTLAKTVSAVVQVHGAETARQLELTAQAPTQMIFATSGPSRWIQMGGWKSVYTISVPVN